MTAFEDDSLTQSGQDSSYGEENSQQEQDPLAIESKVRFKLLLQYKKRSFEISILCFCFFL